MVNDFYAMLGVAPDADRATIEVALTRCQPIWSAGTRNPKTRHTHQSYLDQIPSIRQALLGDVAARASYDAQRDAALRILHDHAIEELRRLIRLRITRGGLGLSDRNLLRAEAVRLGLSHEDLDRLVESIPPRPEAPAEPLDVAEPAPDVIEPAVRRQIHLALEHLQKLDLYDVLGLKPDASDEMIQARASQERQRWMQKSQVTAEKTSWLEAIAYAQSQLGQPEARARYDRTLGFEAEERYREAVRFALAGQDRLHPEIHAVLIEEGTAQGIPPDRSERLIRRHCRGEGISHEPRASVVVPLQAERLLWCRSCRGLNQGDASLPAPEACRHCGASLKWRCPACLRELLVDQPRCSCGFSIHHLELVNHLMEAVRFHYAERSDRAALDHVERLLDLLPNHPPALKARQRIQDRLARIDRIRNASEIAMGRGRIAAAREALKSWGKLVPASDPDLAAAWDQLQRRVKQALDLVAQARRSLDHEPMRGVSLLRQSLALAADLPETRALLESCPPAPPSGLSITVRDAAAELHWNAPASDGLGSPCYVVIRRHDRPPEHAGDGVVVAETAVPELVDRQAPPGEPVCYAVFTRRGSVGSTQGASSGPLVICPDVLEPRIDARNGEIVVSWTPPPGCAGTRVVRLEGREPQSINDGTPIESLHDHAVDRAVENDTLYGYRVHALYELPDGRVEASPGVALAAVPHEPGRLITRVEVENQTPDRLCLRWSVPARGDVQILRRDMPLELPPGTRLSLSEAQALEGRWLKSHAVGRAWDHQPLRTGRCYYVPLTAQAGSYIVGTGLAHCCLPDPADLRAVRTRGDGQVYLRWRWASQASSCLILARIDAPPSGEHDPEALQFEVGEDEYARRGAYRLRLPDDREGLWHLAVLSVTHMGDERLVSPGIDPSARLRLTGPHPEVTLAYTLRAPRFPGRPWAVVLRTEPPGQPVPPTALVAHPRTVPLSADDGDIVQRFPAAADGATFRIRGSRNPGNHRCRVFVDPRSDPDHLTPIRLRHPETGATRV